MIRRGLLMLALILAGSATTAVLMPDTTQAKNCNARILTLKPWYEGLTDANCNIKSPGPTEEAQKKFVWRIVLNIVEDLLQVIGYIAVGFIIYGGFQYMTSSGAPEQAAQAQKTILNAAIGLGVAIASVGLVNLVARGLGLVA